MENLFSNTFVLVIVGGLLLILVVVFILLMSKKKKNVIEEDNSLKSSPIPDLESLNKEIKPFSEQSFNMQLSQSENLSSNSDDFVPLSQLVPEINSNEMNMFCAFYVSFVFYLDILFFDIFYFYLNFSLMCNH